MHDDLEDGGGLSFGRRLGPDVEEAPVAVEGRDRGQLRLADQLDHVGIRWTLEIIVTD